MQYVEVDPHVAHPQCNAVPQCVKQAYSDAKPIYCIWPQLLPPDQSYDEVSFVASLTQAPFTNASSIEVNAI